jgi:predicted nucleic acid-binding protein
MNLENLSVVFDTNIFISSVVFGGKPGEVYMMALNGKSALLSNLFSPELMHRG